MPTILITGTSRGIGNKTALEFLSQGWTVFGTSTSGKCSINHSNYTHFKLDLANEKDFEKLIQEIQELDCVINNGATLLGNKESDAIDFQELKRTLDVNLIGTMSLCEKIVSQVVSGGKIINMSSCLSSLNHSEFDASMAAYKISKAALNMYTRILATKTPELQVIAFDPEWVQTDMGGYDADKDPEVVAKELFFLATTPLETGQFYRNQGIRPW